MSDQHEVWNETVGDAWVRHAAAFDETLAPFGRAAMDRLAIGPGERVLDVGCGAGGTTLEMAARPGAGEVVGVDISEPMLAEAERRRRAASIANARFVRADVEAGVLEPAAFDVVFSRFGVMFFPHPAVAFANLARGLVPGGRIGFVCFQSPAHNELLTVPLFAAAAHVELGPPPGPGEPSPFSLAEPDMVTGLLEHAGFTAIAIEEGPDQAVLTDAGDLDAMARRILEQNPTTAAGMAAADESQRSQAIAAATAALAEHRHGDEVRLGAGTWVVSAHVPA